MPFRSAGYQEAQIKILEDALNRACQKLGVTDNDPDVREQVAQVILALASAGQFDVNQLVRYATDRCYQLRSLN